MPVATLAGMAPLPDHVLRCWRMLDEFFGLVDPVWWGAVVTDRRFPAVWDVNYARIEAATPELRAEDVESVLVPALREAGAEALHVVSFDPEATTGLFEELSDRGHHIGSDLVMELHEPTAEPTISVERLEDDPSFADLVSASLELFGVEPGAMLDQLVAVELDVLGPAGKRWLGVRDDDGVVQSVGASIVLGSVGYLDNVATFPRWRGAGLAGDLTRALIDDARSRGAGNVFLLCDPDVPAIVSMYERLGFGAVGRLVSARGPLPD